MSIPFEIDSEGFVETHGFVSVEGDQVVFRLQAAVLGLVKQAPKVVYAHLADLEEVRFKRGLFKDKLFVRPRSLDLFAELPGTHKEHVKLRVKKLYRDDVYDLLDRLEAWRPKEEDA